MKRTAIILSTIVVLIAIAIPVGAYFLGSTYETYTEEAVAEVNKYISPDVGELSIPVYNKGVMSTSAISQLELIDEEEEETTISLKHQIYHGPVAITPDGVKMGHSYTITTLNREALPDEVAEGITEIYGESEPFVINSHVNFAGGQTMELEFAEVDYKEGTLSLRFDGGYGDFKISSKGTSSGEMEFTAFSLRNDSDNDADDFIVRLKESRLEIDSAGPASAQMEGTFGGLEWRFSNEDAGNPFTVSVGELTLSSDQSAVSEGSPLMVGAMSAEIPHLRFRSGEDLNFSIDELSMSTTSAVEGGMFTSEASYSASGVTTDMEIPDDFALYSAMAEGGAEFSIHATLPVPVAENLAKADMAGLSELEDSLPPEVAEAIEAAIRGITKGTSIGLELRLGDGETATSVEADFGYAGTGPLVEQKTILDVLKSLDAGVALQMPGALMENNPLLTEQMAPLIAMGTIMQNGDQLAMEAKLKEGALTTNGKPNPMLDQMGPMLAGEIPWDDLFQGMKGTEAE